MPFDASADVDPDVLLRMVDSVGVGVGVYNAEGRFIYVNQAYADLFDVSASAFVGQSLWDIVSSFEADSFDHYWNSFEDGETREAEAVHAYNGHEIPVATITTQRTINDTPYHFGTIKDISARKQREQQIKRQNERLENFASIVSHDLRNPLNVAQGYIDLLQEDIDRDELALVDNALDRMDVLITELLELAQSDQQIGETTAVRLRPIIDAAWQHVATETAELVTPDGDPELVADESRLQQLFENLFRNAIDHAGPDVRVTVATTPNGFYVADTGPGIPDDERDKIFKTGYTTDGNGTGFGLSIVQQIVAGHGWEIQITDSDDGGARFDITGVN